MNGYGTISEFFAVAPSATLGALTVATIVITKATRRFFAVNEDATRVAIAFVLSFGLAALAGIDWGHYPVALINACYISLCATGLSQTTDTLLRPPDGAVS